MGKVMKAVAADDQAYARFDFADEAEVWLTFRMAFDSDALAFWTTTNSNDFAQIANSSGAADANINLIEQSPDPPKWASNYPVSDATDTPTPTAATWFEVELHYAADGSVDVYIDTVLLLALSPGVHEDVGRILVGQLDAISFDAASIVYIDDVKAGTTRGGTDLFSDGFEDGTFDAWTTTFGDVSIVDDPFAAASSPRTFEGPRWTLWLAALNGAVVSCLDSFASDRQLSRALGQPWQASLTVPADDPRVYTVYDGDGNDEPLVAEGVRVLLGFRETGSTAAERFEIAWTGLALQVQDTVESGVPVTHMTAWDLRKLLEFLPVVDADGSLDGLPLVFTAEKANVIARTVLENAIDNLLAGTPLADVFDTASGDDEDCGELDMTIEEGLSVAEVWDQLEATGAIDIVLDPVYDPLVRPGTLSVVNFLVEKGTERNAAIFAWDLGPRSLVSVSRLEDGTKRANRVQFYAGQGATSANRVPLEEDTASIGKFGPYYTVRQWPDQVAEQAATAFAQTVLALRKDRQTTVTASPTPARSSQAIQDYDIGDRAPLYASQQLRKPLAGYVRIYAIPFVIGDDAMETIPNLLVSADGVA